MYLVLYKSNYKWWSRLIKWWTSSQYSHCEFYDGEQLIGISHEQRVRKLKQPLNPNKWDFIDLSKLKDIDKVIEKHFKKTQNKKYDWLGIVLSCIFNRRKHNPEKYTCSEWVIECLDKEYDLCIFKDYIKVLPSDIKTILKYRNIC